VWEERTRCNTYVHNVGFLLSDNLVVPFPDLCCDGLTDGTQHTESLHLSLDVLVTGTLQQTESSRGDVELGDLVLLADVPVAGEIWVCWSALEDDSGHTEYQWRVNDVGMSGNPTDIATAEELVAVVNVKHVLSSRRGSEEVAGSGVHDTLGLAGGTRSVEQEERVLRGHAHWREVGGPLLHLLVPPVISAFSPWDLSTGSLEHETVGDVLALLERLVDDLLRADELAAALALVRGDDDLGGGVDDTIAERVGGETGEHDRVHGSDTCASQESDQRLWNHGKVESDGVALLDAHLGEDPRQAGDFSQELAVGDGAALALLIGFVDDGGLVRVLDGVAVDAVVGSIEATLDEPCSVTTGEGSRADGLEVPLPGEEIACHLAPELVGLGDGLLVHFLVLVHGADVRALGMLPVGERTSSVSGLLHAWCCELLWYDVL
jgi:hypothetical protein